MEVAEHDFSLHSGERQVANRYQDIRADHRYRYDWVDAKLPRNGFGLDIFCGNGYGAWKLSQTRSIWGIDGSSDAIHMADQDYRTPRNFFSQALYPFDLPKETFDFVVSLESIEHIQNGSDFFSTLIKSLRPGGFLFFSTPCNEKLPYAQFSDAFHFHHKHYSFEETKQLAQSGGLELITWAGQDVYSFPPDSRPVPLNEETSMQLKEKEIGQFLIMCCRKKKKHSLIKRMLPY